MSQRFTLTKQLTAAVANNICLAQTTLAAGALLLNGSAVTAGVAVLDSQRRIGLASGGDESAVNFTITGTNDANTTISETIAGPNANTVSTAQDFKTVTSVVASAAVANNVTVGTTGVGSTPWWVADAHMTRFSVGLGYELLSGALTVDIEQTDDGVMMPLPIYQAGWSQAVNVPTVVFIVAGMNNLAASTRAEVTRPTHAFRMTITAGAGQGRLVIRQAGLSNR